jgi:DNA-binding YbaB/EbfC family protein
VQKQQKVLGELLEHATVWEVAGAELKLYFPANKKYFAEMLEGRDSLEKLRNISSNALGRAIRVCAKLAVNTSPQPAARTGSEQQELRSKFERDPMVRSIRQLQDDLQRQVNSVNVEASAGGGMVNVKMNGQKQIVEIRIEPEVFAGKDQEMLQDLVRAAVNEASRRVDEELASQMKNIAGNAQALSGFKIPGLF